jgi:outer membrane PBP1 activator LpoA protein
MKNAAEMALAEFQNPNVQLLIKDDGATPQGAGQSTQQALSEGAEIILGPLFALSVPATAQLTRARGVSVIAFSTDSSVAGRGVFLLSFLPESDINRIVDYAAGTGKRSFALLPDSLRQWSKRHSASGRPQRAAGDAFEIRRPRRRRGQLRNRLAPRRASDGRRWRRWWQRRMR